MEELAKGMIQEIKDRKMNIVKRLLYDINPETEKIQYNYNHVLKFLLGEIDEVIAGLIQSQKKILHSQLTSKGATKESFNQKMADLEKVEKIINLLEVNTKNIR